MDGNRFDDLSRALAARPSRRGLLRGLAAGVLGAAGLRVGPAAAAQVTQARCGNVVCAKNPGRCNDGCVCCVYSNGNSRCRPPGTCGPGATLCRDGSTADPVLGCEPECTGDDDCGFSETCQAGTCINRCLAQGCPCAGCVSSTDGLVCGGVGIDCGVACDDASDCAVGEICITSEGNLTPGGCVPAGQGRCGTVQGLCTPV